MGSRSGFSVQPRSRSRRRTKCFVTMPANWANAFLCVLVMLTCTMSVCNGIRDYGSRVDSFGSGSSEELHHDTLFHTIGLDHPDHLPPQGVCEPIKIGLCMEVGYNQTTMPNLVGHDAQADAEALLQTFTPLIQYGCSAHLKLFLCSAYVPMCTEKVPEPIGPCRSLCESVRRSCEPILTEFGFSWPPSLNCSKFHPENNHQHMCIPGPTEQDHYVLTPGRNGVGGSAAGVGGVGEHNSVHHVPSFTTSPGSSNRDYVPKLPGSRDPSILHRRPIQTISNGGNVHHSPDLELQFPFSQHHFTNEKVNSILKQHTLSNAPPQVPGINTAAKDAHAKAAAGHGQCTGPRKVWSKGACWIRCPADVSEYGMMGMNMNEGASANSVPVPALSMSSPPRFSEVVQGQHGTTTGVVSLFEPSERVFARNYILLWASLSLSAALIALTLSVCSPKLSTAERPILYIALCQVLFSIGIIIGSTLPVACFFDRASEQELLAGGEMVPSSCAVVFLLTYFFGTAATLWWVILCLSWLLSVNRRLALSLEQKEWSVFHLASWGLASLLTSAALIHKKVDVDELTGLCGVGFQNTDALTYYNMIPLNVCLASGFLFLLIGIVLRHFTSTRNNPYLFSFGLARLKSVHAPNCEFGHWRQGGHSLRAPQGYSPVLVAPPPSNNNHSHSHSHSHGVGCTSSHGHCACSGGSSSGGGSPSSANSALQMQRIKALQNSKAVWMRVGIFALVHSLPVACQVGTLAYELAGREAWENGKERPNVQIFLLRLNMNLIAGLTTGVWVLSTYSWKSLSSLSTRLCSCRCFKFFSQSKKSKSVPLGGVGLGLSGGGGSCPTTSSVLTAGNSNSLNPSTTPLIPIPQLPPPSLPPFHGNGNTILSTFQSQPPMSNGGSGSGSHSHAHSHSHHLGGGQHQHQHQYQQHGGLPHRSKFSAGGGIVPRHHHHINHPLPPIPPARNNPVSVTESQQQQPPQRTDAWRRGETIL